MLKISPLERSSLRSSMVTLFWFSLPGRATASAPTPKGRNITINDLIRLPPYEIRKGQLFSLLLSLITGPSYSSKPRNIHSTEGDISALPGHEVQQEHGLAEPQSSGQGCRAVPTCTQVMTKIEAPGILLTPRPKGGGGREMVTETFKRLRQTQGEERVRARKKEDKKPAAPGWHSG